MSDKLFYTLQLADNALILGHRLSEWCGHGPVLEQDIAITNMSLDHLGQARSLYQHAADIFNALPEDEKAKLFLSVQINEKVSKGVAADEDTFPYLRDSWDYRNVLLVEQPNGNWADTIARSFFYDLFQFHYYTSLRQSSDKQLAAIAEKSLKEVIYHRRWSSEWVIRLGDGTDESHEKMQLAINDLWLYIGEMFEMSPAEKVMLQDGAGVDTRTFKDVWLQDVNTILQEATLTIPEETWSHSGGKNTRHSEHLGYILAELQYVQRAYPDMQW